MHCELSVICFCVADTSIDLTFAFLHSSMCDGISDHNLICAARNNSSPKSEPKIIEARSFKHFNSNNIKRDIDLALWHRIISVTA